MSEERNRSDGQKFRVFDGEKKELKERMGEVIKQIKEIFFEYNKNIVAPLENSNISKMVYGDKSTRLIERNSKSIENTKDGDEYNVGVAITTATESKRKLIPLFQEIFDDFHIDTEVTDLEGLKNMVKNNEELFGKLFLEKNEEIEEYQENFAGISAMTKLKKEVPKLHVTSLVYGIYSELQRIENYLIYLGNVVLSQKVQSGIKSYTTSFFGRIPKIYKKHIEFDLTILGDEVNAYFSE